MTSTTCSCRYLDHEPFDCPYPAGCTGCVCAVKRHSASAVTKCDPCDEYTVHPDQHVHDERNAIPSKVKKSERSGLFVATVFGPAPFGGSCSLAHQTEAAAWNWVRGEVSR